MTFFAGIDAGAAYTKGCILDDRKRVVATAVEPTGIDFRRAADAVVSRIHETSAIAPSEILSTISCGYGRKVISDVSVTKTEIACHARAARHFFGAPLTILDIGGQDTKLINLDEEGKVADFRMNRKCASGTGAFLEEMARRMGIPLKEMDELARSADSVAPISAFCTVFAATEILQSARKGIHPSSIAKGVFVSMTERALDTVGIVSQLVLTGGVAAYNPFFCSLLASKVKGTLSVSPLSQYTGAVGAALYAIDLDSPACVGERT